MDPISNVDQIMLILRQRLAERERSNTRGKPGVTRNARQDDQAAIEAIVPRNEQEEQLLRRAFVQHVLADQLGQDLVNDIQFQNIVGRVTEAINQDETASRLIKRLIGQLRTRQAR